MTDSQRDMWSDWLLNRRFGGDPDRMNRMLGMLYPVRDKVLSHVDLKEDQTLLDIGCGDGLNAFGALEKFDNCHVIFSDISEDLLDQAGALADQMNVQDRCRFVRASADDLFPVRGRCFPGPEHSYTIADDEWNALLAAIGAPQPPLRVAR